MDIVITGRHVTVSDRFRRHVEEKLAKVAQLAPRARRIDVVVTHEANRRQAKACERVEITVLVKGPVIRAEACEEELYAALDIALDKLMERLRRANDRRLVRRRGTRAAEPPAEAIVARQPADVRGAEPPAQAAGEFDGSPVEVREKIHRSSPMTLSDALREMELVGHDFYLFHDVETDRASVVYRRRGWSYGVLHLDLVEADSSVS